VGVPFYLGCEFPYPEKAKSQWANEGRSEAIVRYAKPGQHIPPKSRLGWGWDAVIILTSFVVRIPLLWLPIKFDEAVFAHMGNMWLRHGQQLYIHVIENKPPGVFFKYMLVCSN